jgi:hypothetical protein
MPASLATPPASASTSTSTKKTSRGGASSTAAQPTVSLTLDSATFAWFETEAKKDDRTVAKFISRTLKAYVADKIEKF